LKGQSSKCAHYKDYVKSNNEKKRKKLKSLRFRVKVIRNPREVKDHLQ
jgi:hypothetical protein